MTKMKRRSKLTVLRKIGAKCREREKQLSAASFRGETFIRRRKCGPTWPFSSDSAVLIRRAVMTEIDENLGLWREELYLLG